MLLLRRLAMAMGLLFALVGTQGPEFAQQYGQRLAGAIDELSRVVATFAVDAASNSLTVRVITGAGVQSRGTIHLCDSGRWEVFHDKTDERSCEWQPALHHKTHDILARKSTLLGSQTHIDALKHAIELDWAGRPRIRT